MSILTRLHPQRLVQAFSHKLLGSMDAQRVCKVTEDPPRGLTQRDNARSILFSMSKARTDVKQGVQPQTGGPAGPLCGGLWTDRGVGATYPPKDAACQTGLSKGTQPRAPQRDPSALKVMGGGQEISRWKQ